MPFENHVSENFAIFNSSDDVSNILLNALLLNTLIGTKISCHKAQIKPQQDYIYTKSVFFSNMATMIVFARTIII